MPSTRAPTYLISVELQPKADDEDHARLRGLLETFLRAIELGFFDDSPQRPASLLQDHTAWDAQGLALQLRFSARDLPHASFAVLSGMFAGYAAHLALPLHSAHALHPGSGDLLASSAAPFAPLPKLPFEHVLPTAGNAAKSLRVWVDFADPIGDALGLWLSAFFEVWDGLVLGSFPAEGRKLGDSWAGPALNAILLPTRFEHALEDYESGPAAFDVLLRGLLRLHQTTPIETLEIE